MNVYQTLPMFAGDNYILRGVTDDDAADLLKVYSDEQAVPMFNGDNCHGDDFHYTTLERIKQAIEFWLFSYDNGYFVRWAIVDKKTGATVGTIELFHRDDEEIKTFDNCGLLRLDLRSDHEKADSIKEIITLIKDATFDLFYCDKIVTKVKPIGKERLKAVTALGFELTSDKLFNTYSDYYILKK